MLRMRYVQTKIKSGIHKPDPAALISLTHYRGTTEKNSSVKDTKYFKLSARAK